MLTQSILIIFRVVCYITLPLNHRSKINVQHNIINYDT